MAESLPITMTKLSQVIGPCVEEGLIYDVVKSIVDIEQGKKKLLKIGKDLNFKRDYIDVRDVASALYIIGQKRQKGKRNDRYDVCSGKLYVIKNVLKMMIKISKVNIKIEKAYDFPVKEVEFLDNSKIRKLGWKPTIPLKQSIKDTIDFMRNTRNT
jgi:GDP-4-dehydro-6-deoxy-D-mannose reductase